MTTADRRVEISRGPKHPLTEAIQDLSAWLPLNERGALAMIQHSSFNSWGPYDFAHVLELFAKQELADAWMKQLLREEEEFARSLSIQQLKGTELLDAISQADTLEFPSGNDCELLHVTRKGARYDDDVEGEFTAATVEGLVERLQQQAQSQRKRRSVGA
jgi:hypothetical protein